MNFATKILIQRFIKSINVLLSSFLPPDLEAQATQRLSDSVRLQRVEGSLSDTRDFNDKDQGVRLDEKSSACESKRRPGFPEDGAKNKYKL